MSKLSFTKRLDLAILLAVAVVLFSLLIILASNLSFQYMNYRDGIKFALSDPKYMDHASVLTYSRAWDFAVVKTSALFLSFLLIFTGALYVLRAGETNFELKAENADLKGSLSLSSPGLIMITLGVLLVAYVLSNKTYVEYNRQGLTSIQGVEAKRKSSAIEPSTSADIEPSTSAESEITPEIVERRK